jgi:phosphatidylserine decarboxylase
MPKTLPTFDVPIYLSLMDQLSVVELVIYDKDMLSKEHLGVVVLLVEDWFANREGGLFDDTRDGSQEKC